MKKIKANRIPTINPIFDSTMRILRPDRPVLLHKKRFAKLDLEKIAKQSIFYLPRNKSMETKIVVKIKGKLSLGKTGYPMICVPTAFGCPHRCIQCGFSEARIPLTPDESFETAKIAIERVISSRTKYIHVMWLSGMQDLDMPLLYMQKLLRFIRDKYSHQLIEVESEARPDQIQNANLIKKLKNAIGSEIGFVIGIGVETFDNKLMSGILNRGISSNQIVRAIENLKSNNIGCLAHVMSHLPILTELESVKNAKKTIGDLLGLDVSPDRIILMALNLQPNNLVWLMEKDGRYKFPSIWGFFKILKELPIKQRSKVHVAGFAAGSKALPLKCLETANKKSTQDAYQALVNFERSGNGKSRDIKTIDSFLEKYKDQYRTWEKEQEKIEKDKKPLLARLVETCNWVVNHKMFKNSSNVQRAAKNFLPKIPKIYRGIENYLVEE